MYVPAYNIIHTSVKVQFRHVFESMEIPNKNKTIYGRPI